MLVQTGEFLQTSACVETPPARTGMLQPDRRPLLACSDISPVAKRAARLQNLLLCQSLSYSVTQSKPNFGLEWKKWIHLLLAVRAHLHIKQRSQRQNTLLAAGPTCGTNHNVTQLLSPWIRPHCLTSQFFPNVRIAGVSKLEPALPVHIIFSGPWSAVEVTTSHVFGMHRAR